MLYIFPFSFPPVFLLKGLKTLRPQLDVGLFPSGSTYVVSIVLKREEYCVELAILISAVIAGNFMYIMCLPSYSFYSYSQNCGDTTTSLEKARRSSEDVLLTVINNFPRLFTFSCTADYNLSFLSSTTFLAFSFLIGKEVQIRKY